MKKMLSFILALALTLSLAACGTRELPAGTGTPNTSVAPSDPPATEPPTEPPTPSEPAGPTEPPVTAPHFTREEFPRLDGSTSTAPLAVAMAALMLGESEEDVKELISFNRTTNSYYNLLNGFADLLIVSEGNEEVYAERERLGFAWEQTPFATDAFVFVVNEANPVESLTIDQVRKIYTGEITNWKEVGGLDEPIIPLQRNPEAGSQSLMEKLVMQGTPMMEPPTQYVATSMGGLMEAVRGYDSSAGAIGYSVYYYAEEMRAAQGLKLLSIEGVAPEPEAIRSGAYPLTNPYYVVIPASAPEGSPAHVIRDWLLSEEGQKLAAGQGYVSVMDLPTASRDPAPEVGKRLFTGYTDELIPGNYGFLIPYAGRRFTDSEFATTGCLYGLMAPGGWVIMDPVCTDIWACGDLLVLTKVVDGETRAAAAAMDGTWWTGFEYLSASGGDEGVILYGKDSITLLRRDGENVGTFTAKELGITTARLMLMRLGALEGSGGEWLGDKISIVYNFDEESATVLYFDLTDRQLHEMSMDDWALLYPSRSEKVPPVEGAWYVYDELLGEDAPAILASPDPETYAISYLYADGTPIPGLASIPLSPTQSVRLLGGLIERLDVNMAEYLDLETLEVVFRTYLGFNED